MAAAQPDEVLVSGTVKDLVVAQGSSSQTAAAASLPGSPGRAPTPCRRRGAAFDAPSPDAIRKAAKLNQLPADKITPVRVLDPYFYRA